MNYNKTNFLLIGEYRARINPYFPTESMLNMQHL